MQLLTWRRILFLLFLFTAGNLLDAATSQVVFVGNDGIRGFWPVIFMIDNLMFNKNSTFTVALANNTELTVLRATFNTINTHFLLLMMSMMSMIFLLVVILLLEEQSFLFGVSSVFFIVAFLACFAEIPPLIRYFGGDISAIYTAPLSYYEGRLQHTAPFLESFGVAN
jgi:hypothetical protein